MASLEEMMKFADSGQGPGDTRTDPDADQGLDPNHTGAEDLDIGDLLDMHGEEPEAEITDTETIQWIMECRREAYDARRTRMRQNNINRDAYMGIQDWSHKQKGQSCEFLPKTAVAAEQFEAFIKKSLIQFGDWFSVDVSPEVKPYITDNQIQKIMEIYLRKMPDSIAGNKWKAIETVISDTGKAGLLESLMVLKVYGRDMEQVHFVADKDNVVDFATGLKKKPSLRREKRTRWHLCIDLIRTEDYFPDPTGRGLYEIHEFERDYVDVLALAKEGVYDLDVVKRMHDEDLPKPLSVMEQRRPQQRGQDLAVPPAHRKRTLITEFWGTILNQKGDVVGYNKLATVGNKKYLIRKAMDNPCWHGRSPFVVRPLIRVANSVWHKALYDTTSQLNFAINEIFNLILDGGIAAVWGIKQIHMNWLSDPRQVENGIPQGATLQVNDQCPENGRVVEVVTNVDAGVVDSGLQVFSALDRELNQASLTNDIQLGTLPQRQVKATEIVQSNESNSVTLSSIAADLELMMEDLLEMAWLLCLQHWDDMSRHDVVQAIGQKAALLMDSLSEAERFAMFAGKASFKVNGLSSVLAAAQEFQKLMAMFQAASQNPIMARSFLMKYDPGKVLDILMKHLNINPDEIALTPDQQGKLPEIIQQLQLFQRLLGQGQPQGGLGAGGGTQDGTGGMSAAVPAAPPSPFLAAPPGSPVGTMAMVNQQIQPLTGLRTTG